MVLVLLAAPTSAGVRHLYTRQSSDCPGICPKTLKSHTDHGSQKCRTCCSLRPSLSNSRQCRPKMDSLGKTTWIRSLGGSSHALTSEDLKGKSTLPPQR